MSKMPKAAAPRRHRLLLATATMLVTGCVVVPRTAIVYDPSCRAHVKQMVLDTAVIGYVGGCVNDGCAVMLATLGIVSAASAVVSGSVAVIGNIVYWVERGGACPPLREPAPSQSPAPAGHASTTTASGVAPPVVPGLVPPPRPAR